MSSAISREEELRLWQEKKRLSTDKSENINASNTPMKAVTKFSLNSLQKPQAADTSNNTPMKFTLESLKQQQASSAIKSNATPLKFNLESLKQQQSNKTPVAAPSQTPIKFSLQSLSALKQQSAAQSMDTPPQNMSNAVKKTPESVVKKFALTSLLSDDESMDTPESSQTTPPSTSLKAAGSTPITSALLRHFQNMDELQMDDEPLVYKPYTPKSQTKAVSAVAADESNSPVKNDLMTSFVALSPEHRQSISDSPSSPMSPSSPAALSIDPMTDALVDAYLRPAVTPVAQSIVDKYLYSPAPAPISAPVMPEMTVEPVQTVASSMMEEPAMQPVDFDLSHSPVVASPPVRKSWNFDTKINSPSVSSNAFCAVDKVKKSPLYSGPIRIKVVDAVAPSATDSASVPPPTTSSASVLSQSSPAVAAPHEALGLVRVVSPIHASKKSQHALGTSLFLSPVRRSVRLAPREKLVAMMLQVNPGPEQAAEVMKLMEATNFVFVPNPALPDEDDVVIDESRTTVPAQTAHIESDFSPVNKSHTAVQQLDEAVYAGEWAPVQKPADSVLDLNDAAAQAYRQSILGSTSETGFAPVSKKCFWLPSAVAQPPITVMRVSTEANTFLAPSEITPTANSTSMSISSAPRAIASAQPMGATPTYKSLLFHSPDIIKPVASRTGLMSGPRRVASTSPESSLFVDAKPTLKHENSAFVSQTHAVPCNDVDMPSNDAVAEIPESGPTPASPSCRGRRSTGTFETLQAVESKPKTVKSTKKASAASPRSPPGTTGTNKKSAAPRSALKKAVPESAKKSVQFSAQLRRVKEIERINPHAPTHNSPTVVASFTFDDKPTEPHMMVEVQPAAVDECEQMTSIDVQRVADILYHQSKFESVMGGIADASSAMETRRQQAAIEQANKSKEITFAVPTFKVSRKTMPLGSPDAVSATRAAPKRRVGTPRYASSTFSSDALATVPVVPMIPVVQPMPADQLRRSPRRQ